MNYTITWQIDGMNFCTWQIGNYTITATWDAATQRWRKEVKP